MPEEGRRAALAHQTQRSAPRDYGTVTLNPELMRAPLPARVVLKAPTLAKALWLELGPTWGTDPSTVVHVELFRANLAVVVLCLFFCRGGAGVECRTGDLTVFAGGRVLAARWAISQPEGQAKGTADTLTTAYVISVTMQKIKYFGGWAMESGVVLDYIDPTVLPCQAAWHLSGWMTPWGGQPARLPRQMATWWQTASPLLC
eukprot:jgi/Tetstr1/456626/TSEL_043329.t1